MSQKEEIATIKERNITVKLSDADVERLTDQAARYGLTVGELIAQFVGDLTDGTYSNGSDERMYAEQWAERCWFSSNDNLLAWLSEECCIAQYTDTCEAMYKAIDAVNYFEELANKQKLTELQLDEYYDAKHDADYYQGILCDILNEFLESHNVSDEILQMYQKEVDEWNQERKKLET